MSQPVIASPAHNTDIEANVVAVNVTLANVVSSSPAIPRPIEERNNDLDDHQVDDILLWTLIVYIIIIAPFISSTIVLYLENSTCSTTPQFGSLSVMTYLLVFMVEDIVVAVITAYAYFVLENKRAFLYFDKNVYGKVIMNVYQVLHFIWIIIGWIIFARLNNKMCDDYTYNYFLTSLIFSSFIICRKLVR